MVPDNGRIPMLEKWLERVEGKLDGVRDDVAALKVKAGMYGGVVALVVSAVVVALFRVVFG